MTRVIVGEKHAMLPLLPLILHSLWLFVLGCIFYLVMSATLPSTNLPKTFFASPLELTALWTVPLPFLTQLFQCGTVASGSMDFVCSFLSLEFLDASLPVAAETKEILPIMATTNTTEEIVGGSFADQVITTDIIIIPLTGIGDLETCFVGGASGICTSITITTMVVT